MSPISWRDVYTLLDQHRLESQAEHQMIRAEIERRIDPLERDYLIRVGESRGEKKIKGMARSTLAILISVATAIGTLVVAVIRS